ncbi:MAG: chromosomal replication initiator protein DnaA [Treponemataceae bacterium]
MDINYNAFLTEALSQIKNDFEKNNNLADFIMYFNLTYIESKGLTIVVSVPSTFLRDQFSKKGYLKLIEEKLYELSAQNMKLEIIVSKAQKTNTVKENLNIERNLPVEKNLTKSKHPQLSERYTFENFVKGDNNAFALSASIAVSKNPGNAYNPILIYGGVGLGKTHLMQAIGNEAYKNNDIKIICVTAEFFTNEFIQSINTNSTNKFKNKYRQADILLIDDIHFLIGKNETQQELFYTYEALYQANKQMVFTCDRPISELKGIEDRLRSRFERGLNVDLQAPKYETRLAILEKKVSAEKLKIDRNILELIAKNICTNVRDLESALTKIKAFEELMGQKLTLEIAQNQLRDVFSAPKQKNISVETIQKVIAQHYNISVKELKGKGRGKYVMLPRHIAIYISRELTEYSTTELGQEFGGRDHTTIMNSYKVIEKLLISDPTLEPTIQMLVRRVKEEK